MLISIYRLIAHTHIHTYSLQCKGMIKSTTTRRRFYLTSFSSSSSSSSASRHLTSNHQEGNKWSKKKQTRKIQTWLPPKISNKKKQPRGTTKSSWSLKNDVHQPTVKKKEILDWSIENWLIVSDTRTHFFSFLIGPLSLSLLLIH